MAENAHSRAITCLLTNRQKLPLVSILAYGSYARGNYRPDSDVDLLVVLDNAVITFFLKKRLAYIISL